MCSLLFDFLCFRLKLFQENRIVRPKSKSIKQKPGIKRPLPMFLKRGSRPQTSRFRLRISERGHHKRWLALGSKIVGEFLYLITRNRGFSSPQPHTYARHRPYHSKLLSLLKPQPITSPTYYACGNQLARMRKRILHYYILVPRLLV